MARPEKVRIVSELPKFNRFVCQSDDTTVSAPGGRITLSVEEYEVIKLMDYYGKTQEECARTMEISRGTVQSLYVEARKKMARHMVEGMTMEVSGGNFKICKKRCPFMMTQPGSHMTQQQQIDGGKKIMKIAVTYENGQVFQHFGHTEQFKVYNVENGEIVSSEVIGTNGQGHGALAGFLFGGGVDVLICGGIGGGARNALAEAGIELYPGAQGDADEQVKSFIAGKLQYDPDTMCHHHDHEEGHSCGEHACGNHGNQSCH